jgi:hypothetical protein
MNGVSDVSSGILLIAFFLLPDWVINRVEVKKFIGKAERNLTVVL